MLTENRVIIGRYLLEKKIGQGGFAQVYLAMDQLLKRRVAVKILNPELTADETFLARFEREAQAVAAFEHPNILSVYDYSQSDKTACLVTPYIEGGTLYDKLYREGKFNLQQAGQYLAQVAAALDYAHRRNIIHRDIKPQNMLLRAEDDRLLLGDFGIAKVLGAANAQTRTGAIGTIYYMSPEQLQGNVGIGTDIYALGCVLFQMLTGELPYTGTTEQIMRGHLLDQVPSVTARSKGAVPPAVQEVINRALAKRPEDRYQTAGELAQAFANVISRPAYPASTAFEPYRAVTEVVNTPARTEVAPRPPVPFGPNPAQPQPQPASFRPAPPNYYPAPAPRPVYPPQMRPARKSNGSVFAIVGIILALVLAGSVAAIAIKPGPTPTPTSLAGGNNTPSANNGNGSNTPAPTQGNNNNGNNNGNNNSNNNGNGFSRFVSPEGRFSVGFPSNPVRQSQQANTVVGPVTVISFQAVQANRRASYSVAYNDYPEGSLLGVDPQSFLHNVLVSQEQSVAAYNIGDEADFNNRGVPGRQTSFRFDQNGVSYIALSQAYLDGDRLYRVYLTYIAGNPPSDADISTFFGSFTITD